MLAEKTFTVRIIFFCALGLAAFGVFHDRSQTPERPRSTPPPWARCVDLPPREDPASCPSCGGNTNTINTFPIDGLHPGGCWNADGMRLVPGQLIKEFSTCPNIPLSLSFDTVEKTLLGVDEDGMERCRGEKLVGARFAVEAWVKVRNAWQVRRAWIRISQARMIESNPAAGVIGDHPSYLFSPSDDPSASLCDAGQALPWRGAWLMGQDRVSRPMATPAVLLGTPPARVPVDHAAAQALIVPGDVFDEKANQIPSTGPGSGWFNIACASGGLAKLTLDGLDPGSTEQREAALKMMTGRYCKGRSYTVPGPIIKWVPSTEPEPEEMRSSLEARWGKDGALCISKSRLWRANTMIPVLPDWKRVCKDAAEQPVPCSQQRFVEDVRSNCGLPTPPCDGERPEGTLWTTYVLEELPRCKCPDVRPDDPSSR